MENTRSRRYAGNKGKRAKNERCNPRDCVILLFSYVRAIVTVYECFRILLFQRVTLHRPSVTLPLGTFAQITPKILIYLKSTEHQRPLVVDEIYSVAFDRLRFQRLSSKRPRSSSFGVHLATKRIVPRRGNRGRGGTIQAISSRRIERVIEISDDFPGGSVPEGPERVIPWV